MQFIFGIAKSYACFCIYLKFFMSSSFIISLRKAGVTVHTVSEIPFSPSTIGSKVQTSIVRLGSKFLYLMNYFSGPLFISF